MKPKENKLEGLICKFKGLDVNFQVEREMIGKKNIVVATHEIR